MSEIAVAAIAGVSMLGTMAIVHHAFSEWLESKRVDHVARGTSEELHAEIAKMRDRIQALEFRVVGGKRPV